MESTPDLFDLVVMGLQSSEVEHPLRFWTDGEEILSKNEDAIEALADLFQQLNVDYISTGYYDPEEDKREGCVDRYTGYYYVQKC